MERAIVGANWGDEGKGKITDMFAAESDVVVRFQGGANAGHTIINEKGKTVLHLLPSGVCYDHVTNVIGNGVALNVPVFVKEVNMLKEKGIDPKILISERAQMVMPYQDRNSGLRAVLSRSPARTSGVGAGSKEFTARTSLS